MRKSTQKTEYLSDSPISKQKINGRVIKLVIKGSIPSKKNSKQWIFRGGRRFLVPSDNYECWHEEWILRLASKAPKQPIQKCKISFRYYAGDMRKADGDNKDTSILDLLKDCGYILDDNWFVVQERNSKLVDMDKANPRCEVEIKEI